jgi:DNA-binding MarR family transcriptional regulator
MKLCYGLGMDHHDARELTAATNSLRELILAAEHYRQTASTALELGTSESQAVSYLHVRGAMGQTALGELLGYNTGTMTALVDRLERRGIAERLKHPTDRRRLIVQLTDHGRNTIESTSGWLGHAFNNIAPDRIQDITVALATIADDLRMHAAPHPVAIAPE